MNIGIMGSGFVGGNLGKGWAAKGHAIMFSSRTPESEKMKTLVAEAGSNTRAGTIQQTLAFGDVVVIALSWDAVEAVIADAGEWSGKIVIDVTNRIRPSGGDPAGSAGEAIAQRTGARVIKAFNSIGAEHYLNPLFGDQAASMLICGDDAEAKSTVASLTAELGFDVVDAGPLSNARLLEGLAALWISLARGESGRDIAFKLLKRP